MAKKLGILGGLFKFLAFWNWRKGAQISDAAERQFTDSSQGIGAGYDMAIDDQIARWQNMNTAAARIEASRSTDQLRLKELNEQEEQQMELREAGLDYILGLQVKLEAAQAAGNTMEVSKLSGEIETYMQHVAGYDSKISEIEKEQAEVEARLAQIDDEIKDLDREVIAMERAVQDLKREKGRAMADFEKNSAVIEARKSIEGLRTSADRGPIDAIRAKNRELTAMAQGMNRRAGVSAGAVDNNLRELAAKSKAGDRVAQMLAARKAERQGTASEATPETAQAEGENGAAAGGRKGF
jgi:chromosome segregation ATPase